MKNYIKLNRKILSWEWYHDINTKTLFLHLLLKANWQDGEWHGKTLKRGSLVSSIPILSEETGLSIRSVRTSIAHLVSTGAIDVITTNRYTIFSVVHYNEYQGSCEDEPAGTDKKYFDGFWQHYPKKEGASIYAARKEFQSAITDGYREEDLKKAAENYSEACGILATPKKYIKMPENFLKDMTFTSYLPQSYRRPPAPASDSSGSSIEMYNRFMKHDYDIDELEQMLLKKTISDDV